MGSGCSLLLESEHVKFHLGYLIKETISYPRIMSPQESPEGREAWLGGLREEGVGEREMCSSVFWNMTAQGSLVSDRGLWEGEDVFLVMVLSASCRRVLNHSLTSQPKWPRDRVLVVMARARYLLFPSHKQLLPLLTPTQFLWASQQFAGTTHEREKGSSGLEVGRLPIHWLVDDVGMPVNNSAGLLFMNGRFRSISRCLFAMPFPRFQTFWMSALLETVKWR